MVKASTSTGGERAMESSWEFMPTVSRSQEVITDKRVRGQQTSDQAPGVPPMPRIKIRVASVWSNMFLRTPL